jgi:ribulose-phosphate 3-epimerase
VKIGPSLLSADFSRLGVEVKKAEKGGADLLHFDIMDGHFVPNITFGPMIVEALRDKTSLPFYVHLMIERPDQYIERFADAGANLLSVHVEACTHLQRTIQNIKGQKVKAGVALNPATPLNTLEYVLGDLDAILVMTVNPGFGGQKFIKGMLPKIKNARQMIEERGLKIDVGVDGGIDEKTAPLAVRSGANVLIAGSAIFNHADIKLVIQRLRQSVEGNL